MKNNRFRLFINAVSSVWATNSNKQVIFRSEKSGDLSFPFASVLPAYEHINHSVVSPAKQSEMACRTNENVLWGVSVRVDDNIRRIGYLGHFSFCLTFLNFL